MNTANVLPCSCTRLSTECEPLQNAAFAWSEPGAELLYTLTLHAQPRNVDVGRICHPDPPGMYESHCSPRGNATKLNPGTNHRDTRSAAGTTELGSSRGTKLILHYTGCIVMCSANIGHHRP